MLGRQDRIFAIISDGKPNDPENECFPPNLTREVNSDGIPTGKVIEPLAVDIRSHGKRDTLLKVAAGLLEVPFDALKRRDRTRRLRYIALIFAGIFVVLFLYAASLFVQTRSVNTKLSSILSAASRDSTDRGAHGRALRLAVLGARSDLLSPPAEDAEPSLVRAIHYNTAEAYLGGHDAAVYSVSFDTAGKRLVTGSQDGTARIWRFKTDGRWLQHEPVIKTGHVADARFAEFGEAIATLTFPGGSISIWKQSEKGWSRTEPFKTNGSTVRSFDISPDGDLIVIGRQDSTLTLWRFDRNRWSVEAQLHISDELPTSAAFSRDGRRLATGFFGGSVVIWNRIETGEWRLEAKISDSPIEPKQLAFSPSSRRLLVTRLGDVRVLDKDAKARWTETGRLNADRLTSHGVFDSLDDRFVVTNGTGAVASLWFEEGRGRWVSVVRFESDDDWTRSISFSPGASRFATGGNNRLVRIWSPGDLGSWRSYAKVRRNIGLIDDVEKFTTGHTKFNEPRAESPDGRRLARGTVYGIVRITDQPTGIEIAAFDASDSPQYLLEFRDGGRRLKVIDAPTGVESRTLDTEYAVALRGGALIAAICRDRLHPPLSIINDADTDTVSVIRNRRHLDVCEPPSLASRIWHSFGWFLGQ
jgi:WD40 repeat protein